MFLHVVVYFPAASLSLPSITMSVSLSLSSDEYKMKGVEEVKYMRGEENRVNARNQENLVRDTHTYTVTLTHPLTARHPHTDSDPFP